MNHLFILVGVSLAFWCWVADAMSCPNSTCYSSPQGSDSAPCTITMPCSFTTALSIVDMGGANTIRLMAGLHSLSTGSINANNNQSILIEGIAPNPALVTITSPTANVGPLLRVSADMVTVHNVQFLIGQNTPLNGLLNIDGENVTFSNCIFSGDGSDSPTIPIDASGLNFTFRNCSFLNTVLTAGSLIRIGAFSGAFEDCLFFQNSAKIAVIELRATLVTPSPQLLIADSQFVENSCGSSAITSETNVDIVVVNSTFSRNAGTSGAISVTGVIPGFDVSVTITDSIFENNVALQSGGALMFDGNNIEGGRTAVISNSVFRGNSLISPSFGAAIFATNLFELTITSCLFLDHRIVPLTIGVTTFSGTGGSIACNRAILVMSNSEIINSSVGLAGDGSGIAMLGPGGLTISSTNISQGLTGQGAIYILISEDPLPVAIASSVNLRSNPLDFSAESLFEGDVIALGGPDPVVIPQGSGGIITSNNVTINSGLNWNGGTFSSNTGTGTLTLGPDCESMWIGSEKYLVNIAVVNNGNLQVTGAGACINGSFGPSFVNSGELRVDAVGHVPCNWDLGEMGSFINNGLFRAFGVNFFRGQVFFNSSGTVLVELVDAVTVDGIDFAPTAALQTARGSLGFEREFPFWPVPSDVITFVTGTSLPAPEFSLPLLNLLGTVSVSLSSYNLSVTATPFMANSDFGVTLEDTPVSINALLNDFSEGGILTLTNADPTLVQDLDQAAFLVYSPPPNFNGMQAVQYTVADGNGAARVATIFISVLPVNDPPETPEPTTIPIFFEAGLLETLSPVTFPAVDIDSNFPSGLALFLYSLPTMGVLRLENGTDIVADSSTVFPIVVTTNQFLYVLNTTLGQPFVDNVQWSVSDGEFETATTLISFSYSPQMSRNSTTTILAAVLTPILVCFCLVAVIAICAASYSYYSRKHNTLSDRIALNSFSTTEIELLSDIVIQKKIGEGNFGSVFKGLWQGSIEVALKTVSTDDFKEIENELVLLNDLNHPNVIRFYGVYENEGLYFVTEFMNCGDLRSVLINSPGITHSQLVSMSRETAVGMNYLHSKDILHRDLACRNLLVSEQSNSDDPERSIYHVKVADFGLSRKITKEYYKLDVKKAIPIRWTAPEVVEFHKYTRESDVWSYGVVLWEIFSRGANPYPGYANTEVFEKIKQGYRMPIPLEMPPEIARIMYQSWAEKAAERPKFGDMASQLKAIEGGSEEQPQPPELRDLHVYSTANQPAHHEESSQNQGEKNRYSALPVTSQSYSAAPVPNSSNTNLLD